MRYLKRFTRFISLIGLFLCFWVLMHPGKLAHYDNKSINTILTVYIFNSLIDFYLTAKSLFKTRKKALITTLLWIVYIVFTWFIVKRTTLLTPKFPVAARVSQVTTE